MSEQPEALGSFLRRARGDARMTQRDVGRKTGISNAYLSQLESGKVCDPSPRILHKLSEVYDVAYSDLLAAAGYPLPEFGKKRRAAFRATKQFGPITEKEVAALKEYLAFLRSKERKQR